MIKVNITLNINNINEYHNAVDKKKFAAATYVRLDNLPGVTALPEMPAATYVRLDNLPGVTALPETSKKRAVYVDGEKMPMGKNRRIRGAA